MKWDKYTVKTVTSAEDVLSAVFAELGVEGVQIEDKIPLSEEEKQKMYIDILPELPEDDGVAYVSFFLEAGKDHKELLHNIKEEMESLREFMDIGEGTIEETTTEDIDWMNNWKEFFKPFVVDDIYIKPSWEEAGEEAKGKMLIEIDPGTAFGTGKHETTRLCIRQLKKYVSEGCKVLDIGCGSGILSIVAARLGAADILGLDVDPEAVKVSWENIEINHISREQCQFAAGNIIEEESLQQLAGENADVVTANILADIIIPLAPVAAARLTNGGIFISSGILYTKEEAVTEAIKRAGMKLAEVTRDGDWVSITARKQG
ncbi:MAG: 50S ribosomal protein L11 methyltransferase [Lachnospiraceae bacterium]|nr:50S ribosomal protein L11 methyltransferase [Lachnospiraceae bacterium]